MKLIALSDIHGAYEKAQAVLSSEWPWDGLIMAGDLTTHGTPEEAARALDMLLSFGSPVAAVCGNMDPAPLEEIFASKEVSVNARGMLWGDIGVFGVSASPPTPMHTPYEISEDEISARAIRGLNDVSAARLKIFVPHAPPANTAVDKLRFGGHAGSTSVRSFIEQNQPCLAVCGHIHEARGKDMINATTVVNCGPAGKGHYAVIHAGEHCAVELKG